MPAGAAFSKVVEEVWEAYRQGKIQAGMRGRGLPRMMHHFATVELSGSISNPRRWPRLAREVRLFLNMAKAILPTPK